MFAEALQMLPHLSIHQMERNMRFVMKSIESARSELELAAAQEDSGHTAKVASVLEDRS